MDDRNLFNLVEAIYAASMDPSGWRDVSEQFGRHLHGYSIFFLHDSESAKVRPLSLRGVDPSAIDEYQSRFAGRNPIVPLALTRPEGTANAIETLVDRRAFDRSIYYNEWFRPNRFHHSTGIRLKVNDTSSLFLTFFRSKGDGEYDIETQRLLERAAPYLRQSVEIGLRLEHAKAASSDFQQALASTDTAAFMLDDRGTIVEANLPAQDLLRMEPTFQVTGGRLFLTSEEGLLLSQHIRRVHKTNQQDRFIVASKVSDKRYSATLFRSHSSSVWLAQPKTMLLVDTPRATSTLKLLEQRHNLTPAESRLLHALVSGESVNEYCSRAEVSRNTVKTQLSQLFAKTGTNKQKDLVRIALRS